MAAPAVEVTGAFDGGNPQDPGAVERVADDVFRVRPFSEDGDGNYKFALNLRVANRRAEAVPLRLEVEWADERYMPDRNYVHVGAGDDWRFVPTGVSGTVSTVVFRAAPGVTHVGISPEYGLERYATFADRFAAQRAPRCTRRTVGMSRDGRSIDAWEFGAGPSCVFVLARVHPYETAASYCAEGLMQWLAAAYRRDEALLSRYRFVAVPMPNPDGVARGLCKRTALTDGADLERQGIERAHPETAAMMELLGACRPIGFLDIHGWMHFDEDGVHCSQDLLREAFLAAADETTGLRHTRWNARYAQASPTGLRHYCLEAFGSRALAASYRWPTRTADDMRAVGASTLTAFLRALEVDAAGP